MTILQPFTFKWIPLQSAVKITSWKVIPKTANTNDIELVINRYTDSTCTYDIEQFTKMFSDVSDTDVPLDDLVLLETILLAQSDMAWGKIV